MVVEGHGQVVGDEVLRGTPEVHGVPVLELRPVRAQQANQKGRDDTDGLG